MAEPRAFKDLEDRLSETEKILDALLSHQQRAFRLMVARRFSDPLRDIGDELKADPETIRQVFKKTHDRISKLFELFETEEVNRSKLAL